MIAKNIERNSQTRGRPRRFARVVTLAIVIAIALGMSGAIGVITRDASAASKGDAAEFHRAGRTRSFASAPHVYEWTYQMNREPPEGMHERSNFDRIGLHRVAIGKGWGGRERATADGPVMLYLPGTNMNGEVAVDDPRYSLPLFMATHGVDFWAIDYRTHFIPAETPKADLSELKGWTGELFATDIEAAADFVMRTTGRSKIFVAGFSRGATFAYLFAAQHPKDVAGLVIYDGWIPLGLTASSPPPNHYADDVAGAHLTYEKRQALMAAVIANPDGPAPIAKYKTARQNLEAVVYGAGGIFGGHGGLANPAGGYSDAVVLARMLINYDRYWPTVQDYEDPFTPGELARLSESMIPVIAFSSGNIGGRWPSRVAKSASSTGSASVSVTPLAGWGHLDVICGTHAEAEVFEPTLAFVEGKH
jgi:pimeloyl-ACP methyl ester carboxylesterase